METAETQDAQLPLTDRQRTVERCVEKLAGRPKHCGRSAFSHLRKAWRLYDVDLEMSAFRAITAEEEAATALILALKVQRYPGAEALDHRRHDHKAGVAPFLEVVAKAIGVMEFARPKVRLDSLSARPRLDVLFSPATLTLSTDPTLRVRLDEPFNFVAREGPYGHPGEVMKFAKELEALASSKGAGKIHELIRVEANLRNRLLYAQDGGIPSVTFARTMILKKLHRVCVILQIVIGILQTPTRQLFAVQCLEAYLAALSKIPPDGFDFDIEEPCGDHDRIVISKLDDQPIAAELEFTRQVELESVMVTDTDVVLSMVGTNDGVAYVTTFSSSGDQDPPGAT